MPLRDLMIDIETMGTDTDAAIISIGAVRFDLETGDVGAFAHEPVNLHTSVDVGMKIDPGTVLWWLRQSREAQDSWNVDSPKSLVSGLSVLSTLAKMEGGVYQVWANAPTFDCAILRTAFTKTGITVPWKYYSERCVRTLIGLASEVGFDKQSVKRQGTAHSALDDCYHQIELCCRAWRHIKHFRPGVA